MPQYLQQIKRGELDPAGRPELVRETEVCALIDAHRGFGHFSTAFAMDWAMERAPRHGLASVAIRQSGHIGRVGEYTERALERGLLAMATVGASGPGVGGMVLFGGTRRFFGANPWSLGAPGTGHRYMFDGSTSTIAEGKVRVARAKGAELPPDCVQDAEGGPSRDPEAFYAGGALMPLGGAVAGHKGYGLAMGSALFSALAVIDDHDPTLIGASTVQEFADEPRGRVAGVWLLVVDPGAFGDAGAYRDLVEENLTAALEVPPAEGREVQLPGEFELRNRLSRAAAGIELPDATWRDLIAAGERLAVAPPAGETGT
jgi:LDH2 family malate/lactate/ureidoglycolate dehydrogenase